jgi:hypothetical protein
MMVRVIIFVSLVFGYVAVSTAVYVGHPHAEVIRHRSFTWEPKPDITLYELSLCLPMFAAGMNADMLYDKLPPKAQRHWKEKK